MMSKGSQKSFSIVLAAMNITLNVFGFSLASLFSSADLSSPSLFCVSGTSLFCRSVPETYLKREMKFEGNPEG